MSPYAHHALTLARFVLQSYTLTKPERDDEAERLAQAIEGAIEACTENLGLKVAAKKKARVR